MVLNPTVLLCFQKAGKATPSFVMNLLNDLESKENITDEMDTIRNCAGLAYAGMLFHPYIPKCICVLSLYL